MPSVLVASSVAHEDVLLGTCECGGSWRLSYEEVVPLSGRWFDAIVMRCATCGEYRRAVFDITSFFEPPTLAWSRQ